MAAGLNRRFPFGDAREPWDRGYALSQIGGAQIEALLNGQTFFASTNSTRPIARLAPDAAQLFHQHGSRTIDPKLGAWMAATYDPATRSLIFRYRSLGGGNIGHFTEGRIDPMNDAEFMRELAKQPLITRLNEWAKTREDAVMKTPLDRQVAPPPLPESNVISQSDLLRWIHRKTGIPTVGDAFRVAIGYADFATAGTVEEAVKKATPSYNILNPLPPYVRSEKGWLMLRHRRYWRRQRAETPESSLRPLEAKVAARTPLNLDDYAKLVAGMTPAQMANAGRPEDFLVEFSTHPLKGMAALRLWAALPASVRKHATGNGIPLASLSGPALIAAQEFVRDRFAIGLPSEQALPSLLPGGTGFPESSILRIRPHGTPGVFIYSSPEIRQRRMSDRSLAPDTLFAGWNFGVFAGGGFSLEQNIPIQPLDPSKPGSVGGPPP